MPPYAPLLPSRLIDLIGHGEIEHIASISVIHDEHPISGLCLLQSRHQHHGDEGRSRMAHGSEEGGLKLRFGVDSAHPGEPLVKPRIGAVDDRLRVILDVDAVPLHEARDGSRYDLLITLLSNEPILPSSMHLILSRPPPHIEERARHGVNAIDGGGRLLILPDEEGRGPVAEQGLEFRIRRRKAIIRSDNEHLPRRSGFDHIGGELQSRGSRPQGVAEIQSEDILAQIQSRRDDARGLLLDVRGGGGSEEEGVYLLPHLLPEPAQAVHSRLHAHGEGVLIGSGHRLLPSSDPSPPHPPELLQAQPVNGNVSSE